MRFDDGEVERVTWRTQKEVREAISRHGGKSWTFCGYEIDLLKDFVG